MENPFESGYIKNYILFYSGAVAIAVLFFIATNLFYENKTLPKKEFKVAKAVKQEQVEVLKEENKPIIEGLRMMPEKY